eukprot:5865278-Pleurochrysis_carterae.AAC.2
MHTTPQTAPLARPSHVRLMPLCDSVSPVLSPRCPIPGALTLMRAKASCGCRPRRAWAVGSGERRLCGGAEHQHVDRRGRRRRRQARRGGGACEAWLRVAACGCFWLLSAERLRIWLCASAHLSVRARSLVCPPAR